jgi:hypothetical protein
VKTRILGALSAVAAATLGVVLIASAASAAPPTPTTTYPAVPIIANACPAQAIKVTQAQNTYNNALAVYNRAVQALNAGVGSQMEVLTTQQALDNATIALNDANYAQATCQNTTANPANANCVTLTLEFNRLTDDLAVTQDLEAVAKAISTIDTNGYNQGVVSKAEYEAALTAYQNAQAQTKLVQVQLTAAQTAATNAGCKNITRPVPPGGPGGGATGTGPASPAPSSTPSSAPSGTPSTPSSIPSSPAPAPSDSSTAS